MEKSEFAKVFETVLSIPGMQDSTVRIDLRISRKNALLLSNVISHGLSGGKGEASAMIANLSAEELGELKEISTEFLAKAGLTELSEKLNQLSVPK